jgi:hypothetical protein
MGSGTVSAGETTRISCLAVAEGCWWCPGLGLEAMEVCADLIRVGVAVRAVRAADARPAAGTAPSWSMMSTACCQASRARVILPVE